MYFTYDRYKGIETPDVFLAYPNKKIICPLDIYEPKTKLCFNNISSGSFKVYKYKNNQKTPFYDLIKIGMYLEIQYISWFKIRDINPSKDKDGSEYLEVSYYSLEAMLCNTYLTSFGSLGVESDEQGGLDRYCLYNDADKEHSIAHIVMEKNPAWYFKTIDPEISRQYRNFDVDSITTYEFLTQNVSQVFECIFIFDTYDMSISAYKLDNIGKYTSIFLSDRNFIKSITSKSSDADIKTVFNVSGGNDARTNTTLDIIDVNPAGNNTISDFSYFKDQMSPELQSKLEEYNIAYVESVQKYTDEIESLKLLYDEISKLKNKVPDDLESTDWTQYGLVELQTKEAEYKNNMSIWLNKDGAKYSTNYNFYKAVEAEINIRKAEITIIENQISEKTTLLKISIVNLQDFLGEELHAELSVFVSEQDFQDDSFVATTTMTEREILEMQQELMAHARNELSKVCYPQYDMTVDAINFTARQEFVEYTEQLELGNIITLEWEPGELVEVRLLEMDIDWDKPDNFTLKFSNKNLDTEWAILAEIQQQATSTASSVNYNKGAWNVAKQTSLDFLQWKNGIMDVSLQKLQNSSNQEMLIDETGLMLRSWLVDQNKYSPNQVWMTNGQIAFTRDDWQNVCTALGIITLPDGREVYGIAAEYLIGDVIVGEQLILRGSCANLDFETNDDFRNAQVAIKANSDGILLKVSKDDIINSINLSEEGILISGDKIDIEGCVTFKAVKDKTDGLETGTTVIDGGCITTGTINAARINTDELVCKILDCGDGYLQANSERILLGNLRVYNEVNGNTYLADANNSNSFGMGNGAHFYSNWGDGWGGLGTGAFQVATDGTTYINTAVIGVIEPRLSTGLEIDGAITASNFLLEDGTSLVDKITDHTHSQYVTSSELSSELKGYSTTGHTHSQYVTSSVLSNYVTSSDFNSLQSTVNTINNDYVTNSTYQNGISDARARLASLEETVEKIDADYVESAAYSTAISGIRARLNTIEAQLGI